MLAMRTLLWHGHCLRAVLSVVTLTVAIQCAPTTIPVDTCQLEITNAGNGTVQPTMGRDARHCTWSVGAPPDHKLLVKVDKVLLNDLSSVIVVVDGGVSHNFTGQCDSCADLPQGQSFSVVYNSGDIDISHSNASPDFFSISYRSFDPLHCSPPPTPTHGRVVGRDRRVGSRISFRCNPPYVMATTSKRPTTEAICEVSGLTLYVPTWSIAPLECVLPECGKTPITLTVGVADTDDVAVLVHPGFPHPFVTWKAPKMSECVWEVSTGRKKHLVVSVERADLPDHATLELYDGRTTDRRRLDGPTDPVIAGATYATVGKLVVILRSGTSNEAILDDDRFTGVTDGAGFKLRVTARKTPCGVPVPPVHGDVRGSAIVASPPLAGIPAATSSTPTSVIPLQMMVFYSCDSGFQLTGASNSTVWCPDGAGEFTSAAPLCVALSPDVPSMNERPVVVDTILVNVSTSEVNLDTKVDNASEAVGTVPFSKSSRARPSKDRRPHPQSTEEKTNVKSGKGEEVGVKQPVEDPTVMDWSPTMTSLTEAERDNLGGYDSENAFEEEEIESEGGEPDGDAFLDDTVDDSGANLAGDEGAGDFPVVAVALGVALPLLLITLAVVAGLAYRRLYPVRMNMGRKFDTFENPVYNRNKRDPNTTGTLLPGASLETPPRPAELQKLMANRR